MSFNGPPKIENQELKSSKIELHFFRHSIKESNDVNAPNDNLVVLSSEGKKLAKDSAFKDVNLKQAVAFGSSRIRAQETAGFMMSGQSDEITGTETLSELKEKLDKDLKVGSKIGMNDKLNFVHDGQSEFGKAANQATKEGGYTKFIIEKSDDLVKELQDESGSHYSAKAREIGKIVEKYISLAPRWSQLVNNENSKYTDTLERYLGTHQGMLESFLAKVIEKTEGKEARAAFVDMIGHQGFDYLEGCTVTIQNKNNIQTIFVDYSTEKGIVHKEIPFTILEEITQE